ncbi:helix-turn-helix domain-containing protein [Mesorhizobium sp. 128a]
MTERDRIIRFSGYPIFHLIDLPASSRTGKMQKTLRSPRHVRLVQLIVEKRRKAGLSQHDLAKALDRYQSVVAAIESGGRRIDVVEFLDLAETIGFDPHEVLREVVAVMNARPKHR